MNNFARAVYHLLATKTTSPHDLGSFALSPQEHLVLVDLGSALRASARELALLVDRAAPPPPWAELSCLISEQAQP